MCYRIIMETSYIKIKNRDSKVPLIITAPHGCHHYRPNLTGVYRQPEEWTREFAELLAEQTQGRLLSLSSTISHDPNYHSEIPFKEAFLELALGFKKIYHLDVHGLDPRSQLDLLIKYPKGFRSSKAFALKLRSLKDRRELNGLNLLLAPIDMAHEDSKFAGRSLSEVLVKQNNGASVQLEVSADFRQDETIRNVLAKHLSEILNEYLV